MKQFVDFIPIAFFVITYYFTDIYYATAVLMLATVGQVVFVYFKYKKVPKQLQITFWIIIIFGGLTLSFQDKAFIQWKPTVVNWFFAIVLISSQIFSEKNLIERMLGSKLKRPGYVWRNLNLGWAFGLFLSGVLNLYVAYNFSEGTWVTYKLIGGFAITLSFMLITLIYLLNQKRPFKSKIDSNSTP